ncbi:uncharacterized protein LOC105190958 [Harpegnathos saltator]|uniref:uncharacterized protein LOC105190958 n=1 Tax=Harpegnathos saltator TaxID=610380 RepID=UPI0005908F97|nr:uncharacterized protein LOC105190958 [Harpegnathos saltator]
MLPHRSCTWLMLMPLLLSLSTGELSFYRDALPETSEDIALKYLARYLKAQRLQQYLQPSFRSPMHKKHSMQLDRQRREFLEVLKKTTLENLRRQHKLKTWPPHYHQQYNPINKIIPEQDYLLNFYDLGLKVGYPKIEKSSEDDGEGYGDGLGYGRAFPEADGDAMEPMLGFHGKWMESDDAIMLHEGGKENSARPAAVGEAMVTYRFDKSNLEEKHPFAVKPNDLRYYSRASSSDGSYEQEDAAEAKSDEDKMLLDKGRMSAGYEDNAQDLERKTSKDLLTAVDGRLEQERSAAHHPLIVPVNHDLNSDIYFIAVVAGCSAAAMFALVLISLTWCRLQRGAKAAADIEYPAYGVTGPNKDVSPSGDQRLAQSAQMYHFQHQKQQIIAMENRTSATRDPGSLSEAESDEENEEGDYTVYECPGLASTGEMEVKNPMFHDDPTPATPAQSNNKEEDHI